MADKELSQRCEILPSNSFLGDSCKLNWQPGVQQAKYANENWYSSQQLEAKGQGRSALRDELSPRRWRQRCTDGKSARLFCLRHVPRMDKYTTRCSSLSRKLSLLTSATLIKTESKDWEVERSESFERGVEWCVLSVLCALVQLLLLSETKRVPERGEINLNSWEIDFQTSCSPHPVQPTGRCKVSRWARETV